MKVDISNTTWMEDVELSNILVSHDLEILEAFPYETEDTDDFIRAWEEAKEWMEKVCQEK